MVQAEHKRGENQRACTPQTSYLPQASVHGSAKEKLFRKRNNASAAEKKRRKRKRRPGRSNCCLCSGRYGFSRQRAGRYSSGKPSLSRKISPLPPRQQQMPRATKAIRSKNCRFPLSANPDAAPALCLLLPLCRTVSRKVQKPPVRRPR